MAKAHGKGGSITCTGLTAGVKSWSGDFSVDLAESTDFADGATGTGYKTRMVGVHDMKATIEALWDSANTAREGDVISGLVLTATSGKTYTVASAIIESMSVKVGVDDINTATYNVVGNGAVTVA